IGARAPLWLGMPPTKPPLGGIDTLLGFPEIILHYLNTTRDATIQGLIFLFFMAVGYIASRKNWKQSILIFLSIGTTMQYLFGGGGYVAIDLTVAAPEAAIASANLAHSRQPVFLAAFS